MAWRSESGAPLLVENSSHPIFGKVSRDLDLGENPGFILRIITFTLHLTSATHDDLGPRDSRRQDFFHLHLKLLDALSVVKLAREEIQLF